MVTNKGCKAGQTKINVLLWRRGTTHYMFKTLNSNMKKNYFGTSTSTLQASALPRHFVQDLSRTIWHFAWGGKCRLPEWGQEGRNRMDKCEQFPTYSHSINCSCFQPQSSLLLSSIPESSMEKCGAVSSWLSVHWAATSWLVSSVGPLPSIF